MPVMENREVTNLFLSEKLLSFYSEELNIFASSGVIGQPCWIDYGGIYCVIVVLNVCGSYFTHIVIHI